MWRLNVGQNNLETCVNHAVFGVNERYGFNPNEILLLQMRSKDVTNPYERIKYYMHFVSLEDDAEKNLTDHFWGEHFRFLVRCKDATLIEEPFTLSDVQSSNKQYGNARTANKIDSDDEPIIFELLKKKSVYISDDEQEKKIKDSNEIPVTEKEQLIKARRGQGVFRNRVGKFESCCRLTGVSNKLHLIASHIKPWAESSNEERLNGENGLLLSPHVDHLFDKGYISFSDEGDVLFSKALDESILNKWLISKNKKTGTFTDPQKAFLEYHRKHVFNE